MNIAIVYYSQTGTTALVAKVLAGYFGKKGHTADLFPLKISGSIRAPGILTLVNPPDVTSYDNIIFAGPVTGFRASPVIMKYLSLVDSLAGKRILCCVTKGLPFLWTGGRQAVELMEYQIKKCEGTPIQSSIIFSKETKDETKLPALVKEMGDRFLGV